MADRPKACDAADAASGRAEDSGEPGDHADAADAHGEAAKAAFKAGMPSVAKAHLKKQKKHQAKAVDPKKNPIAFLAAQARVGGK